MVRKNSSSSVKHSILHLVVSVRTALRPSGVLDGRFPRLKFAVYLGKLGSHLLWLVHIPSASSHARPAPNPVPNQTGHALRLNRSTEKITPKEKPRVDRITRDDIARSHCRSEELASGFKRSVFQNHWLPQTTWWWNEDCPLSRGSKAQSLTGREASRVL